MVRSSSSTGGPGDLFARFEADEARWETVPLGGDPDEARLAERLVARDERAFNALVLAYQGRVFALLVRMIGHREEARDLAQEVFMQVFKAIGQFRGDSKLSTWIYRIAINLCKNRSKYLRVRHSGEQDELDVLDNGTAAGGARDGHGSPVERPDEMAAGKQLERIVQSSILKLEPSFPRVPRPPRCRGFELRRDRRHHGPSRGDRQESDSPCEDAAEGAGRE